MLNKRNKLVWREFDTKIEKTMNRKYKKTWALDIFAISKFLLSEDVR